MPQRGYLGENGIKASLWIEQRKITMIEGMILRAVYSEWLGRLEQELQPAFLQDKEECVRCGLCCARRPCIPTPDELKAIAGFLGMELEEAVRKYFVGAKNHECWVVSDTGPIANG